MHVRPLDTVETCGAPGLCSPGQRHCRGRLSTKKRVREVLTTALRGTRPGMLRALIGIVSASKAP